MTTSKQQVSRLLAMVPYLQAHPGVGIEEVARIFGITAKQVLADLQVLWMCGTPGGLPDDLIEIDMDSVKSDGVIHLANADYLPRPLRFARDEAMSLVVALQTIAETASGELAEAARSAADKLRAIGAEAPVLVAVRSGDPQVRDRLTTAINAGKAVRLTYDGAARSTTTHPVVDPGLVVLKDSVAYLHGWSHERRAWRIYRLDRIAEVEILSQQVTYESLPALGTGWFDEVPEEVLLHLAPEASWIRAEGAGREEQMGRWTARAPGGPEPPAIKESPHREPDQTRVMRYGIHPQFPDLRPARTFAQPFDEGIDHGCLSMGEHLDVAVRQIAHPSGQAQGLGPV